jgi:hypothetical protein
MTGFLKGSSGSVAVVLRPIDCGWVVALTDGRELARFTGPFARRRGLRYVGEAF